MEARLLKIGWRHPLVELSRRRPELLERKWNLQNDVACILNKHVVFLSGVSHRIFSKASLDIRESQLSCVCLPNRMITSRFVVCLPVFPPYYDPAFSFFFC